MDFCDIAAELEAKHRAAALSEVAQRWPGLKPYMINGVEHCCDCLRPIPKKRLDALPGVGLCVMCQAERESEE